MPYDGAASSFLDTGLADVDAETVVFLTDAVLAIEVAETEGLIAEIKARFEADDEWRKRANGALRHYRQVLDEYADEDLDAADERILDIIENAAEVSRTIESQIARGTALRAGAITLRFEAENLLGILRHEQKLRAAVIFRSQALEVARLNTARVENVLKINELHVAARLEKLASQERRNEQNSARFLQAAKEMLPRETWLAIWNTANPEAMMRSPVAVAETTATAETGEG